MGATTAVSLARRAAPLARRVAAADTKARVVQSACLSDSRAAALPPLASAASLGLTPPRLQALRCLATRAKKQEEGHESVPVSQEAPAEQRQMTSPTPRGPSVPWFPGGGLAAVLPRMLAADPFFGMPGGGPFGMADRLMHDLEDVLGGDLEEAGVLPGEVARLWAAVDVKETPDAFLLSTDVPGLARDDVKVTLEDNNVLRITGERKREEVKESEGYKRTERSYGSFERRFKIPGNVNAGEIKADLAHGVLNVTILKKPDAQPQSVEINVGEGKAEGKDKA